MGEVCFNYQTVASYSQLTQCSSLVVQLVKYRINRIIQLLLSKFLSFYKLEIIYFRRTVHLYAVRKNSFVPRFKFS